MKQRAASTAPCAFIAFWDREHGVAVGLGQLRTTENGGASWKEHMDPGTGMRRNLRKVVITGPRTAVVASLGGGLLRSEDRGMTWQAVEIGETSNFYALAFPTQAVGYAAGQGKMWKTMDGGVSWQPLPSGLREIYGMHFFDPMHGIAVGRGVGPEGCFGGPPKTATLHVTDDGGATWTANTTPAGDMSSGVHSPTPQRGFAVGSNSIVMLTLAP